MQLDVAFGFLAALGWAISCALWARSAMVKFPGQKGMTMEAAHFEQFANQTGKLNSWGAAVGAVAAVCSAISLFIQNLPPAA